MPKPAARLVKIYNSLTGVTPVTKFKDRKTAATRIWKAIQTLGQPVSAGEAQELPAQDEPKPEPETNEVAIPEQVGDAEPASEQAATVATDAQQAPDAAPVEATAKKKAARAKKAPAAKEACDRLRSTITGT